MENTNSSFRFRAGDIIVGLIGIVLCAGAMIGANMLFKEEFTLFAGWWISVLAMGVVFMPLCAAVFCRFADLGWMFSKVMGIAFSGWLMWYLSSLHILRFTRTACIVSIGICLALNILFLILYPRRNEIKISGKHISLFLLTEGIFLVLFVFWLFIKGYGPKAYGTTEKLMDFGFMMSMFKSDYMPPEDFWLAGENLNYYYVGQFLATYITKVSGVGVEYGYNFMMMMLPAMAFSLPSSIVYNVSRDHLVASGRADKPVTAAFPVLSAGLAGIAVSFCGNMHYVLFAKTIPTIRNLLGIDKLAESASYTFPAYWFPNSTRYIGYNPETHDKTIHEFPSYSFVLGDLHAHVINLIFVLTVVAVLYAYLQFRRERMDSASKEGVFILGETWEKGSYFGIASFFREVFNPCIILTGFFIGLFHTTNFWDFPIYFVVSGAVILFSNAVIYDFSKKTVILTFFHAVAVIAASALTCLPFTLSFKKISSYVLLCTSRTPLYQLVILWGLPITVVAVFLAVLIRDRKMSGVFEKGEDSCYTGPGKQNSLFRFIGKLEPTDLFILTLGLCAFGLVLLPELIYVKDIYSGDYKRANTMFKLTYQAFTLFGISMGYIIPRLLFFPERRKRRIVFAVIAGYLLISTAGYFENATKGWFGDWTDPERYEEKWQGLNCGEYLKSVDQDDYDATNWINANIEGRPVMLEVNGDSYKDYCRVSIRTGLPTVLGWKTHEWLWQSWENGGLFADTGNVMPSIVTTRDADIRTIYTSDDPAEVGALVEKYDISYIYVGRLERGKYEDAEVNHQLLQSLGTVVYPSDFDPKRSNKTTYIIKIQ